MVTQIWILLIVYQESIYANTCPDSGQYCLSIYENAPNGEQCSSVNTKQECITLMRKYPCIWNPHNNLPNSNFIDLETMKFVEERPKLKRLEKIHKSSKTKPDLYRLDDCDLVYALNHRDNSILDGLEDTTRFSLGSIKDGSVFENHKSEAIYIPSPPYSAIGYLSMGNGKHCTATLISPKHIVSAANCFMTYTKDGTNFNFISSINHVKFYPALTTPQQDISNEYHIGLAIIYIHAQFISYGAVCLSVYIRIYLSILIELNTIFRISDLILSLQN